MSEYDDVDDSLGSLEGSFSSLNLDYSPPPSPPLSDEYVEAPQPQSRPPPSPTLSAEEEEAQNTPVLRSLFTPNEHRFTPSGAHRGVQFAVDDNEKAPSNNAKRPYIHPHKLTQPARKRQNQRLHRDTERAIKTWLEPAKHLPKFKKAIDEIMHGTMITNPEKVKQRDNLVDDGMLKSNPQWFTAAPDSPSSIESHASFIADEDKRVRRDQDCIDMQLFEDDTIQKLKEEIVGMWTRRFVQKRTKPKVLNACFNQRISLLLKYLEEAETQWDPMQNAYINLLVRVRLHWDSSYQWYQIVSNFRGAHKEIIMNYIHVPIQEFEDNHISEMLSDFIICKLLLKHMTLYTVYASRRRECM